MKKIVYRVLIISGIIVLTVLPVQILNLKRTLYNTQNEINNLSKMNQKHKKLDKYSYNKDIEEFINDDKLYIKNLETNDNKKTISMEIGTIGNFKDIDNVLKKLQSKDRFKNFGKISLKQECDTVLNADINVEFKEDE
ncbi:hypothetical protein D4Z93_08715 [Clostridium fermenticellae]|uniref:Uncharacterized protein n=1 Tax=Clostridium fermenticellae TaxID=2068654 RepID=A0A386H518_9CLOT|nr:hypothetical protein [Clostridium fermenticellae]AYD40605.1 hypothetical protein D4Z93_08715 [Clostridium fermenticellae]